jgi:zinc finger protein
MSLKYLGEEVTKCLNCGERTFRIKFYIYNAPLIGNIVIESGVCETCKYRKTDVFIADLGEPRKIELRVKSDKELRALVVKSSTATIRIPELGIEIKPGPAAPGYITTVEGILDRVLEVVPSDCYSDNRCYERIRKILEAKEGKHEFTLILEDPFGRSTIKGKDIEVKKESNINY